MTVKLFRGSSGIPVSNQQCNNIRMSDPRMSEPTQKSSDLKSLLTWIIGGTLVSIWLYGAYHAYSGHGLGDAAWSLLIPPYGLYMAMEANSGHAEEKAAELAERHRSSVTQWCYQQDITNSKRANLNETQKEVFCSCVSQMFVEQAPPDLVIDKRAADYDEKRVLEILNKAGGSCLGSAIYLGRRDQPEPATPAPDM
jgi:hypothetical protein